MRVDGWGSEEGGSVGQTGLKGWVCDARATTKRRLAAAMLRCLLTSDSGSEGERDDRLIEERRGEESQAGDRNQDGGAHRNRTTHRNSCATLQTHTQTHII